ncbi:UPF0481 protein At3g47200-like [Populus alba]|uniref:UPF0481 protein At3g47200-like n=1 Tax=Populus alba TaxID=43335 RepID=UPI0015897475|nr:UPF0481 protein At3g47200-like [Populus alba]
MDAAFVILFLLKYNCSNFRRSRDNIFYPPYKWFDVRVDICLLENQLPCFRLMGKVDFSEVKHLVGFLSIYHRPPGQNPKEELEVLTAPSVKELHQAGVKFVLSSSKHLLDIKFDRNKGILEIPRLQLVDNSEIIIRNLQAFEQCHRLKHGYVSAYIFLMGVFLGASKDVEILVENRIVENWLLSNEEVVKLFYNLNIGNLLSRDDFLFKGVIKDLNAFCERPWNKWKATLKQNYFNTPWAALSISGDVILLILTVIQSVCSILQVVLPKLLTSRSPEFHLHLIRSSHLLTKVSSPFIGGRILLQLECFKMALKFSTTM